MYDVSIRLLRVIDDIMAKHGITQSELERRCGLSTVIPNVRNGKVIPSLTTVCKILSTYKDYSADWVLFGDGDMMRSRGEAARLRNEVNKLLQLNIRLQERLAHENR